VKIPKSALAAAAALTLPVAACGNPHPASPLWAACQKLTQANALTHPSTAACYRCESHGSQYMLFLTNGDTWQCNDPRW
jgi:hypothetical protein